MSETLHTPGLDPTRINPGFERLPEAIIADGVQYGIYEVPELKNDGHINRLAVDNVEGFRKLAAGDMDSLTEGESVSWAPVHDYQVARTEGFLPSFRRITRHGDNLVVQLELSHQEYEYSTDEVVGVTAGVGGTPLEVDREDIDELIDNEGQLGFLMVGIDQLTPRQDKLGETFRELGFVRPAPPVPGVPYALRSRELPLPATIVANIKRLRESGLRLPNVRLLAAAHIEDLLYDETFKAGEFPAAKRLNYYGHDLATNHFRVLVAFDGIPMDIAQMYATAGFEAESVTIRQPKDAYAINDPEYRMVELTSEGTTQKLSYMATTLDQLTSEMDTYIPQIDTRSEDLRPLSDNQQFNTVLSQVVETILASSQREDFIALLERIESSAIDEQGKFSVNRFETDLIRWAQKFWEITPPEPAPAPEPMPFGSF